MNGEEKKIKSKTRGEKVKNWKRVKGSNFYVFNLFKNDGPQNIISLIWLPTHELQREPFAVLKVTALHRVTSYDVLS